MSKRLGGFIGCKDNTAICLEKFYVPNRILSRSRSSQPVRYGVAQKYPVKRFLGLFAQPTARVFLRDSLGSGINL